MRPCMGSGAPLGEEAVLADSGRAREVAARVGRVRSLAFLNILQLFWCKHYKVPTVYYAKPSFSAAWLEKGLL